MNLLILFIILNAVNVITQTIKSICTIKCGKLTAALVNAIAYSIYTIVIVYMNCDLSLWAKVFVVGACNFVGVYVVKVLEQKFTKDKLWKVEATISKTEFNEKRIVFKRMKVPHNYIDIGDYVITNFYCSTQSQSLDVKKFLKDCNAKYFVSETKSL
jgi:hypothetical protein